MITLKHRTASGDLSSLWEFDICRGRVVATVRLGAAEPIDFEVPVCSEAQPRHGAYPVQRLDANTWRVAPACYLAEQHAHGHQVLVAQPQPVDARLPPDFVLLTDAPADVSDDMAEL